MRIIAFFTLLFPALAGAQTFGGVGARAEGMAGAFVALADDASAIYWNPAGIATGATFDFQLFRGDVTRRSTWFVGATMPVLGVGAYRTHTVQGPPDRQVEGPGVVEVRTLSTTNIGLTFVQTVVPHVVIGTTVRMVTGETESFDSRRTADLDVGAMVTAGNVRMGVTGRNLRRPEFEGPTGAVPVERQVRAGFAFAPRALPAGVHGPYSVAFDADLTETSNPLGEFRLMAIGGEYWLAHGLVGVRAGFRWNTQETDATAMSAGLTVKLPRSVYVEGHMTNPKGEGTTEWSAAARVTF